MFNKKTPTGSMVEPATQQPFVPSAPGATPINTGAPLASSAGADAAAIPGQKPHRRAVVETILLVVTGIIAVVFIWLYVQKYIEWNNISTDLDGQIDKAVAEAVANNTSELETEFAEREKYPYKSFMGPVDYGSFSFEYPKTWSVYIARDAANGGDFEAYLNPVEVEPVSSSTINALRVRIRDTAFESVAKSYEGSIKNGKLTLRTETVGGALANIYTGELSSNMRGAVMLLKLRDKTVILQTDAEIFLDEFNRILQSVSFIE